jgi:hypothetical protein
MGDAHAGDGLGDPVSRKEPGLELIELPADLPSRFWRNASNFRELFAFLSLYVATIKFAYIKIYPLFNSINVLW